MNNNVQIGAFYNSAKTGEKLKAVERKGRVIKLHVYRNGQPVNNYKNSAGMPIPDVRLVRDTSNLIPDLIA